MNMIRPYILKPRTDLILQTHSSNRILYIHSFTLFGYKNKLLIVERVLNLFMYRQIVYIVQTSAAAKSKGWENLDRIVNIKHAHTFISLFNCLLFDIQKPQKNKKKKKKRRCATATEQKNQWKTQTLSHTHARSHTIKSNN